eukprot:EG_transcript_57754
MSLGCLPAELLLAVLDFCPRTTLIAAGCTCRALRTALNQTPPARYALLRALRHNRPQLFALYAGGGAVAEDSCTACFFTAPRRLVAAAYGSGVTVLHAVGL